MLYSFEKNDQLTDCEEINKCKALIEKSSSDLRFYKSLIITDEFTTEYSTVRIGDAIFVANADEGNPYIAKVEAFFDYGTKSADDKFAHVAWFFQNYEIPKSKQLQSTFNNEIFLCTARVNHVIDAETIRGRCIIHYNLPKIQGCVPAENTYVCTKSFDGRKFKEISNPVKSVEWKSRDADKPKVKIKVSGKALWSTLSPAKNTKPTATIKSAPASASALGRLDASAVASDFLEGLSDSSDFDDEPERKQTTSKKDLSKKKSITRTQQPRSSSKSVRPPLVNSSTDAAANVCSVSRKSKPLNCEVNLKVSMKRLDEENKENSFPNRRRSTRIALKKVETRSPAKRNRRVDDDHHSTSSSDSSELLDDSTTDRHYSGSMASDTDRSDSESHSARCRRTKETRNWDRPSRTPSRTRRKTPAARTPAKTPRKDRRAVIPKRQDPLKLAASDFDEARERLHVSAVPDSLPCREREFQSIYSFIEGKIQSGAGGCMYISGVPGTGKTATVMEVLSCLRESVADGVVEKFDFVDINGMRLTEPRQAYVSILKQLKDVRATSEHAADLLTKHFNTRGKKATLLLVDELDLLWTKKQDVLYHIFDWPSHRHARLIVVAIANTMDLPERIMMNKVSSRLGLTRLSFLPYNFKQLQEIIASRLRGLAVFDPDAIQLVARKVAAVSGDARRCLDVCRRAIEVADGQRDKNSAIKAASIEQVHEAIQEMFASPIIALMRNCSDHEKLVLRSVVAEFRRSGVEEATLGQVLDHHNTLAKVEGLPPSSVSSIVKVCNRLTASRLLLLEAASLGLYSRIRLNVSVDDVLFALNDD